MNKRHMQSGVTLIELLLSIGLISILVTIVAASFVPAARTSTDASNVASATARARLILDTVSGQWTTLPNASFDKDCAVLALNANETVRVADLTPPSIATPSASPTLGASSVLETVPTSLSTCANTVDSTLRQFKRVTVSIVDPNNSARVLAIASLDVARAP